jgi:tetratricopeptide (TPR) repeat protein
LDKFQEAIENYDLSIKYNQGNEKAYYKRGYCQFRLNDYEKAVKDY